MLLLLDLVKRQVFDRATAAGVKTLEHVRPPETAVTGRRDVVVERCGGEHEAENELDVFARRRDGGRFDKHAPEQARETGLLLPKVRDPREEGWVGMHRLVHVRYAAVLRS